MAILELTILILGILLLVSTHRVRKIGSPFYPTPLAAIRYALREVATRPGEKLYDLGAGTGRVLLIAEKEFGAKAIGYEMSFLFYVIAKINLWLHGSHAELHFGNFLKKDLRDADVIFCFLVARALPKVEDKLMTELRPGARIICYGFPTSSWKPIKTIPISGRCNIFI